MRNTLSLLGLTAMLAACGGNYTDNKPQPVAPDYKTLQQATPNEKGLVLADTAMTETLIKNGVRLQLANTAHSEVAYPAPAASPSLDKSAGSGSGSGFSQTNVHVQGVDEADVAKYDGQHWFVATSPTYDPYSVEHLYGFQVVATDPQKPNAKVVGQYTFEDKQWGEIGQLYLVQAAGITSHVATLRNQWGSIRGLGVRGGASDAKIASKPYWGWYPTNGKVQVNLMDVRDATAPTKDWELNIDGSLIDSRKIGNTLYLITRYDPWIGGLTYESDTGVRATNESTLGNTALKELMPHYTIGSSSTPLATRCYIQEGTSKDMGFASLVSVTAIDLGKKAVIGSLCLNSDVGTLSMSGQALYLAGTAVEGDGAKLKTVIHKFSLGDQGPIYLATGSAQGSVFNNSDPAFRFDEYKGDLRVVTSDWSTGTPVHKLTILEQRGSQLAPVANLPNAEQPAAIGKPGENIYSVRFNGEKAFIVTFQQRDPLYTLDLSDRLNPKIGGELDISGYGSYLHPMGENYLFSLGQEADDQGRVLGLKAELFDVSGPSPRTLNKIFFGQNSHSPAEHQLHALTFLPTTEGGLRVAIPVSAQDRADGKSADIYCCQYRQFLQLLEARGVDGKAASLVDVGKINTVSTKGYDYFSRSILHNDAVFFTQQNAIYAANWFDPKGVVGPITAKPEICTAEVVDGLNVTVTIKSEKVEDACATTVVALGDKGRELLKPVGVSANNQCTFTGAAEVAGYYRVVAYVPGEFSPFTTDEASATVLHNACHVIPEQVALTLARVGTMPCTAVVAPSLNVTTTAAVAACKAEVTAYQAGKAYPLTGHQIVTFAPTEYDSCAFTGPFEAPGLFDVVVKQAEGEQKYTDIFVPKDTCHVQTQSPYYHWF